MTEFDEDGEPVIPASPQNKFVETFASVTANVSYAERHAAGYAKFTACLSALEGAPGRKPGLPILAYPCPGLDGRSRTDVEADLSKLEEGGQRAVLQGLCDLHRRQMVEALQTAAHGVVELLHMLGALPAET